MTTTKTKHSPSPWNIIPPDSHLNVMGWMVEDNNNEWIARLGTNEANARLIACAPEMYEVLKKLVDLNYSTDEVIKEAFKVIKKIEGKI